ncbi:hypothetical protein [Halococcoides cellulosivorans]|uniref:Uncharacterized protein n=1 Tax=Halococcoides cellulosivorans TaxID=1679096 RepID=A0A2R4X3G6_9EURY|nr:hypothetical protein [Halococcoides cellulosivorans]AWB28339.1 hypothetical protein HARCEL1_11790 [Halococcoides cellulosivorans]
MIEQLRTSPLLSVRRAVAASILALLINLSHMWVTHIIEISTPEELLAETLIHGTGLYLALTLMALFTIPSKAPN